MTTMRGWEQPQFDLCVQVLEAVIGVPVVLISELEIAAIHVGRGVTTGLCDRFHDSLSGEFFCTPTLSVDRLLHEVGHALLWRGARRPPGHDWASSSGGLLAGPDFDKAACRAALHVAELLDMRRPDGVNSARSYAGNEEHHDSTSPLTPNQIAAIRRLGHSPAAEPAPGASMTRRQNSELVTTGGQA